jgi:hypothetical protein
VVSVIKRYITGSNPHWPATFKLAHYHKRVWQPHDVQPDTLQSQVEN